MVSEKATGVGVGKHVMGVWGPVGWPVSIPRLAELFVSEDGQ
jgi:hypothetical protein